LILLYLLGAAGFAFALGNKLPTAVYARRWLLADALACAFCTGFWTGGLVNVVTRFAGGWPPAPPAEAVAMGVAFAFSVGIVALLVDGLVRLSLAMQRLAAHEESE